MSSTTGTAGGRLRTITVDQAVSSASNLLVTILAARVLDIGSFGRFGIVFLVYVATQGVVRALVGEPLLVRPDESQERPGEAIGTGLLLGLGVGALVAIAGLGTSVWDGEAGRALLVLAAATPLLVLQDLGRFLAFATHRPGRALLLDLLWLGLVVVTVGVVVAADAQTLPWFIAAWAGSGAVAGLLLLAQHRGVGVALGFGWLRETWSFSKRYAMSFAASQGGVLLASVALAGILGAAALGAVRGVLLLYGPLVQLQAASIAAGVAEVARHDAASPEVPVHVRRTTSLTVAAAIVNVVLLLVLPDRLGELVLGDTWEPTSALIVPAGVQMVFLASISGVRSALVGLKQLDTTLRIDIASTVIAFATSVGGAVAGGVETAFWCLAAGQGAIAVAWRIAYHRVVQDPAAV